MGEPGMDGTLPPLGLRCPDLHRFRHRGWLGDGDRSTSPRATVFQKALGVDLVVVADTSARQIGGSVGRWSRQGEKMR